MSIGLEVTVGDSTVKPKIIKLANGTYVVKGVVPDAVGALTRAVWVKTIYTSTNKPIHGKGFLVGLNGHLIEG